MEANRGQGWRLKAPEGDDRHTDTRTLCPLYDDVITTKQQVVQ